MRVNTKLKMLHYIPPQISIIISFTSISKSIQGIDLKLLFSSFQREGQQNFVVNERQQTFWEYINRSLQWQPTNQLMRLLRLDRSLGPFLIHSCARCSKDTRIKLCFGLGHLGDCLSTFRVSFIGVPVIVCFCHPHSHGRSTVSTNPRMEFILSVSCHTACQKVWFIRKHFHGECHWLIYQVGAVQIGQNRRRYESLAFERTLRVWDVQKVAPWLQSRCVLHLRCHTVCLLS